MYPDTREKKYALKKFTFKALNVRARGRNKRKHLSILICKVWPKSE